MVTRARFPASRFRAAIVPTPPLPIRRMLALGDDIVSFCWFVCLCVCVRVCTGGTWRGKAVWW